MKRTLNSADIGSTGVNLNNSSIDRNFGERINSDVIVYTVFGKQDTFHQDYPILLDNNDDLAVDRPDAYAKEVFKNNTIKYYVKRSNDGHLYNPFGGFEESRSKEIDRHRGKDRYEFIEVTKNAFSYYLSFLKTKNRKFLSQAERLGYLQ